MNARRVLLIGAGLLSISALMPSAHSGEGVAQNGKPVVITRFFTGPDGLTHAEEIEVKFAPGGGACVPTEACRNSITHSTTEPSP
jgi:hypothetical protein